LKAILQRVTRASVRIVMGDEGPRPEVERAIGAGYMVLLGVALDDDETDAERIVDKVAGLRVFDDEHGKMNLNIGQIGGQMLVVSQFTLLADTRKGRRPSFTDAAPPERGKALYEYVVNRLRLNGLTVETGEFGAHMQVELINDGPVTIVIDTRDR
jgi:D-tyrosyl-tRNA(Tyr) deacylase